jgi:hypothetical protein
MRADEQTWQTEKVTFLNFENALKKESCSLKFFPAFWQLSITAFTTAHHLSLS